MLSQLKKREPRAPRTQGGGVSTPQHACPLAEREGGAAVATTRPGIQRSGVRHAFVLLSRCGSRWVGLRAARPHPSFAYSVFGCVVCRYRTSTPGARTHTKLTLSLSPSLPLSPSFSLPLSPLLPLPPSPPRASSSPVSFLSPSHLSSHSSILLASISALQSAKTCIEN